MAVRAQLPLSSSLANSRGQFLARELPTSSSCSFWCGKIQLWEGRNVVTERFSCAERGNVMGREMACCTREQADGVRSSWDGIRAQGMKRTNSSFRSAASGNLQGIHNRDGFVNSIRRRYASRGRRRRTQLCASLDDPYETLGVSSSATEKEIKQAYRKLALKFHPDVNKEADAQQKFLHIKAAYQTLVDSKSRAKYDASKRANPQWDPFSWEKEGPATQQSKQEEFYGLEDFFRDLQADSRKKEKTEAKAKSLWEELAEVGEEFVEFLEKELNISDVDDGPKSAKYGSDYQAWDSKKRSGVGEDKNKPNVGEEQQEGKNKVESDIQEIEEMLAKIKKELGI